MVICLWFQRLSSARSNSMALRYRFGRLGNSWRHLFPRIGHCQFNSYNILLIIFNTFNGLGLVCHHREKSIYFTRNPIRDLRPRNALATRKAFHVATAHAKNAHSGPYKNVGLDPKGCHFGMPIDLCGSKLYEQRAITSPKLTVLQFGRDEDFINRNKSVRRTRRTAKCELNPGDAWFSL